MKEEPKLSDFIYEEIRQCEEYALMNMITFEAAIRNSRVKEILSVLNSVSAERQLDSMLEDTYDVNADLRNELKENYYLDYYEYHNYIIQRDSFLNNYADNKRLDFEYEKIADNNILDPKYEKLIDEFQSVYKNSSSMKLSIKEQVILYKKKQSHILHINHDEHTSHTHRLSLPLYRPKIAIPHKDSFIDIKIPMYHIHPKDIKAYYMRLATKHLEVISEAKDYYKFEELFYNETNETQSKSTTYAEMFFLWDYIEWWKGKNNVYTPNMTLRSLYAELANIIKAPVNDKNGRSAKVEKNLEKMNKLIDGGYKKYYE